MIERSRHLIRVWRLSGDVQLRLDLVTTFSGHADRAPKNRIAHSLSNISYSRTRTTGIVMHDLSGMMSWHTTRPLRPLLARLLLSDTPDSDTESDSDSDSCSESVHEEAGKDADEDDRLHEVDLVLWDDDDDDPRLFKWDRRCP